MQSESSAIPLFGQVAELVEALVPDDLRPVRSRFHRRGIKVWFGPEKPAKEHYEAQVLSRTYVDGNEGMAVEVGFHAEHPKAADNAAVLDRLRVTEAAWRKAIGGEPEMAEFFGAPNWRRVSETWIEPDLDDPDLAFEIASRLVDYLTEIEPARQG